MVFTPLLGATAVLLVFAAGALLKWPRRQVDDLCRAIGLLSSGAVLGLGIILWLGFRPVAEGVQFVHRFVWIRDLNVEYFLGVDGLSISMVLLTALVCFAGMIASLPWFGKLDSDAHHPHFSQKRVAGYMVLYLLLETGIMGTFCALDMFLFYIFWELMLLPMYFLIGIWGAPTRVEADGRVRGGPYAAIKFFLYTLAGSVLMLLAILAMYFTSGPGVLADGTATPHTFNLLALAQMGQAGQFLKAAPILGLAFSKVIFVAFFIGFAIKVPMFPFHTWLPDAHVDAPTPISVILAGILLKTGAYGILRFNFAIFPDAANWAAFGIAVFGAISILYGAFVCMAQTDLKKLIAYSSVSHMGFCLLGFAARTDAGMSGAMYMMIAHGIISPMCFLIAGVVYDRAHTRDINGFGGLAQKLPEYAGLTGLAFMASLGLPGLAGFIAEALVFLGAFGSPDGTFRIIVGVSVISVVVTAGYYLWTMHRMFLGPLNEKWGHLWDVNWRERLTLYPLAALTIALGIFPMAVLDVVNPALCRLVDTVLSAGTFH
jgi:NADH-quinone oxidoreductase subunit M